MERSPSKSSNHVPASPSKSTSETVFPLSRQLSTSLPSSPLQVTPTVYKHIRSLDKIVGAIHGHPGIRPSHDPSLPSFGDVADNYLQAHGYNLSALYHIQHALTLGHSHSFINYLASRGMAWTEAEYLWDLIHTAAD